MSNRVVVTGIGIWSCLGKNIEEVKESLFAGRSGIILNQERLDYGYHSGLTGNVEKPDLRKALDRRTRMGMSEESEYAYVASKEAFDMAKIDDDYLNNNEVGVIFGNDSSAKAVIECQEIINRTHDSELIGSGNIFQSMNSTVNMNMSTIFRLR
jgi:3-oxoacyl-[acyl-carrier-protein] synthase-1